MPHVYRLFDVEKRELIDNAQTYAGQEGDSLSTVLHFKYKPEKFSMKEFHPHIIFDVRDDNGNPLVYSQTSTASFNGYEFEIPWELTVRIKKPVVKYQLFFIKNDVEICSADDIPKLKASEYMLSKPDEIFIKPSIMPKHRDDTQFSPATEPSVLGWIDLWKKYGLIWPVKTGICPKTGRYKIEFTTYADNVKHEVIFDVAPLDENGRIPEKFLPYQVEKTKENFPSKRSVPTSMLLYELLDDLDYRKQDELRPGTNVEIKDGVISATGRITGSVNFRDVVGYPSECKNLKTVLDAKQDDLSQEQLDAVNSGITKSKVDRFVGYEGILGRLKDTTDKQGNDITTLAKNKQGNLTQEQLDACNSGINTTKREKYDGYEAGKQNTLNAEQMKAVDSTITKEKVDAYNSHLDNKIVHITQEEREKWNKMQPALNEYQMAAVNSEITDVKVAKYESYDEKKQNTLNENQMNAVNSTITKEKVAKYDNYSVQIKDLAEGKQPTLTDEQLEATKSGINATKVNTYDRYGAEKQNKLDDDQLSAVNSTITEEKVKFYDNFTKTIARPFLRKKKINDFLYEVWYNHVDYESAYDYLNDMENYAKIWTYKPRLCSAVRKGNVYGRNYDWYYDNQVEFIVHTPAYAGRLASVGVGGGVTVFQKDFVKSNAFAPELYVLPDIMYDGINEAGLVCNQNVVPDDYYINGDVIPTGEEEIALYDPQLVRFVLDNFSTVHDAEEYIKEHVRIKRPNTPGRSGYYIHMMIADEKETKVLELIPDENGIGRAVFLDKTYLTNFNLYGVKFNDDGTVYTPLSQDEEHDAIKTNNVTQYGGGLERYNIIAKRYESLTDEKSVRQLMKDIRYTETYPTETRNNMWFSEFTGSQLGEEKIKVNWGYNTGYKDLWDTVTVLAKEGFAKRSRETATTWQTRHSTVYSIKERKMNVVSQEDFDHEYEFTLE